ncbi:MAG: YeiH family protein [Steroidobacterales bacterium]
MDRSAHHRNRSWWLGVGLTGGLAAIGMFAAQLEGLQRLGLSGLTVTIALGIIAGNMFFPLVAAHSATGVDFSKSTLLRAGIILYGFRITFQQIGQVGWTGVLIDVLMVGLTFLIAVYLGTRVFRLDRQTSMLIGAGSAICGAAAVMATEPIVRGQAHKVSVAVATVVVFGTLAMFIYPPLYARLGLSQHAFGIFAGSTIHEVAQVIAAGKSVSDEVAGIAVIEKMLRVMMLAPFLLLLSAALASRGSGGHATTGHATRDGAATARAYVPWFALLFIAASAMNSLQLLPAGLVALLVQLDTLLLAMAMAALGLRTHVGAIRQAGVKPLLLAATLFIFLAVGGYAVNRIVTQWLG